MLEVTSKKYRRRKASFTFHYHADCKRFPTEDYIDVPTSEVRSQMVCFLCKKLEKKDLEKTKTKILVLK